MGNITYLLGAGASYERLPIVTEFNQSLKSFYNELSIQGYEKMPGVKGQFMKTLQEILNDSQKHKSIDTLAKKYHLTGNKTALADLKSVLTIFLCVSQIHELDFSPERDTNKGQCKFLPKNTSFLRIDKRYDSLLASLLRFENEKVTLPRNVNFLTWNYDIQFELAFAEYLKGSLWQNLENANLRSYPFQNDKNLQQRFRGDSKFDIIHLNGAAGLLYDDTNVSIDFFQESMIENYFSEHVRYTTDQLIDIFFKSKAARNNHKLLFAWEHELKLTFLLKKFLPNTTTLVIIGYSFPYFNREIDSLIFKMMKRLKTIYYVDPHFNGNFLYDQFGLNPNNVTIKSSNRVEQFPVPDEFYREESR